MTVWQTIERGEYVMIALAVVFVIILCIWIVRGSALRSVGKDAGDIMQRVRDQVTEGDLENASRLCETRATHGAKLLRAGLRYVGHPMTEVSEAMSKSLEIEKERMTAGMGWLRFFGVVSPLFGLGGTLVGVVDRLRDLGELGPTVDISMVCREIAPTIVSTVAGLVVGIFAFLALTCVAGSLARAHRNLETLETDFINLLNEPS